MIGETVVMYADVSRCNPMRMVRQMIVKPITARIATNIDGRLMIIALIEVTGIKYGTFQIGDNDSGNVNPGTRPHWNIPIPRYPEAGIQWNAPPHIQRTVIPEIDDTTVINIYYNCRLFTISRQNLCRLRIDSKRTGHELKPVVSKTATITSAVEQAHTSPAVKIGITAPGTKGKPDVGTVPEFEPR